MSGKISFSKTELERAKKDGVPLTAICFEDRHLTTEQGGRVGRIAMHGPMNKRNSKKILDLILALCKSKDI